MSVYSGFATREQETFYYKLLEKAVQLMSKRIIAFFRNDQMYDDRDWVKKMRKIFKFMNQMDQSKHLQPRFSSSMVLLIQYLRDLFGTTSSLSKSPPSLIGGNNTSSTLQIIEEEVQSEQMLSSLQYAGKLHNQGQIMADAKINNIDKAATATFFPNFKQQPNLEKTQVIPSQRKDYAPVVEGNNMYSLPQQQEESFSKKLFKKISETRLAKMQGDTNQEMANYIQNGVKQRASFMGIMTRDLNKKTRDSSGGEAKPIRQHNASSRNLDDSRNHSIHSTARVNNQSSILDLVSGVTTDALDGYQNAPYQTSTIGNLRNDRRFTLNGTKQLQQSYQRYIDRASSKLSPSNNQQCINTQSSLFSKRDDSCGSVQSIHQKSRVEDYASFAKPLQKRRQQRQTDLSKQQYTSNSAAKLPSSIMPQHVGSVQSLDAGLKQNGIGEREKSNTTRVEEGSQPVIQLHTKHYHYNTNNIKIQMMPGSQIQDISKISAEGESFRDERAHREYFSNTVERKKQKRLGTLLEQATSSGVVGRNHNGPVNDYKFQLTTGYPRRVMLLSNQNQQSSTTESINKLETPKKGGQKKYFQLY